MGTRKFKGWSNFDRLVDAIRINSDKNYKSLIEKAISLGITGFDYCSYRPEELRRLIGEKLNEISVKENKVLREDFYNSNSRGC